MANNNPVVPLYPESFPSQIPEEHQPRINEWGWGTLNIHYPTLEVCLPDPATATGCGVVICPGGGYGAVSLQNEGYDIARWLNSFGVAGFILRYRLPTDYPFPTPQLDLRRAMRLVRSNAPQWGLKSDRIGVIGFSAGGHLASTLATLFDAPELAAADVPRDATSCRPDFAILAYPVIAFSQDYCHAGTRENLIGRNAPAELVRRMSTELQVTAQTPPTFLFHSTDDQSVDVRNAVDFYLACKAKGVSAAMHLFPHGGHGYGVGGPGTDESQWPAICQRWMGNLGLLKK